MAGRDVSHHLWGPFDHFAVRERQFIGSAVPQMSGVLPRWQVTRNGNLHDECRAVPTVQQVPDFLHSV